MEAALYFIENGAGHVVIIEPSDKLGGRGTQNRLVCPECGDDIPGHRGSDRNDA